MATASLPLPKHCYTPKDAAALELGTAQQERNWFAVTTLPRNEKSVARYLDANHIESFLPTSTSVRRWRNRQNVTVVEALFPTYVFVRIHKSQQSSVLRSPGVRRMIGNRKGPIALPTSEVELLRSRLGTKAVEAVKEPEIGERVRICSGPMQGVEGTLIRKKSGLRFVLTLHLINQSAALEVAADEIEAMAQ